MRNFSFKSVALVATLALTQVPSFANEKGGIFAGLDIGSSINFEKLIEAEQGKATTTTNSTAAPYTMNFGFKAGYSYYFLRFLGVRGYVDYNYGFNLTNSQAANTNNQGSSTLISAHNITANVDVMFDFYETDSMALGVYAGIGLGYGAINNTTTSQKQNQNQKITQSLGSGFVLPVNLGLSLTMQQKHKVDLGVRISTLEIKDIQQPTPQETITQANRLLQVLIGYSYTF